MTDEMDPLPDGAAEFVRAAVEEQHGYLSWLGTRVEVAERDRMVMTIPFDEKLTNPTSPPTIHGGVAATLVDTAGGLVQRLNVENPVSTGVATVNLNVNYLRRATGDLTATAEVVRTGTSVGVSEVDVVSKVPEDAEHAEHAEDAGEERLVATGQPSYRIFR